MVTLLTLKPYRWWKCIFGARSFIKESQAGRPSTYAVISGDPTGLETIASELLGMGYKEEWAKEPRSSGHWE